MTVQRNPDGTLRPGSNLNPLGAGAPKRRIWDEFQRKVEENLDQLLCAFLKGFSDEKKGYIPTKENYLECDKALDTFSKFQPKDLESDNSTSGFSWQNYRAALQQIVEHQVNTQTKDLKIEALEQRIKELTPLPISEGKPFPTSPVVPPIGSEALRAGQDGKPHGMMRNRAIGASPPSSPVSHFTGSLDRGTPKKNSTPVPQPSISPLLTNQRVSPTLSPINPRLPARPVAAHPTKLGPSAPMTTSSGMDDPKSVA